MKLLTLRDARDRAKLTQEELADRSGVDQTTISRLETSDDPNPTRRTVDRLAQALGIAPSRLRFSDPEPVASVKRRGDRAGHSAKSQRESVA